MKSLLKKSPILKNSDNSGRIPYALMPKKPLKLTIYLVCLDAFRQTLADFYSEFMRFLAPITFQIQNTSKQSP
jgi:hypothetical protein